MGHKHSEYSKGSTASRLQPKNDGNPVGSSKHHNSKSFKFKKRAPKRNGR